MVKEIKVIEADIPVLQDKLKKILKRKDYARIYYTLHNSTKKYLTAEDASLVLKLIDCTRAYYILDIFAKFKVFKKIKNSRMCIRYIPNDPDLNNEEFLVICKATLVGEIDD